MRLFHSILLCNSLFACALVAGGLTLNQVVPTAALVAIAAVLVFYALGTWVCLVVARSGRLVDWLDDVDWMADRLPGVAMLGTVAGFMAQGHNDARLTVLISTFVGIACWQVLGFQHRLVSRAAGK